MMIFFSPCCFTPELREPQPGSREFGLFRGCVLEPGMELVRDMYLEVTCLVVLPDSSLSKEAACRDKPKLASHAHVTTGAVAAISQSVILGPSDTHRFLVELAPTASCRKALPAKLLSPNGTLILNVINLPALHQVWSLARLFLCVCCVCCVCVYVELGSDSKP